MQVLTPIYEKQFSDNSYGFRPKRSAHDAEERSRDRNKDLSELYQEAALYQGAASKEGQDKYKSILDQIESLQKEERREQRQAEQRSQEDAVNAKIQSLDEVYKLDTENLEKQYETMKESAADMAKTTALNMESEAVQVTDGLTNIFDEAGIKFDGFSEDAINKFKTMAINISYKCRCGSKLDRSYYIVGVYGQWLSVMV